MNTQHRLDTTSSRYWFNQGVIEFYSSERVHNVQDMDENVSQAYLSGFEWAEDNEIRVKDPIEYYERKELENIPLYWGQLGYCMLHHPAVKIIKELEEKYGK